MLITNTQLDALKNNFDVIEEDGKFIIDWQDTNFYGHHDYDSAKKILSCLYPKSDLHKIEDLITACYRKRFYPAYVTFRHIFIDAFDDLHKEKIVFYNTGVNKDYDTESTVGDFVKDVSDIDEHTMDETHEICGFISEMLDVCFKHDIDTNRYYLEFETL